MPAPQNNQGFVAPRSGGTGNWIGKLFGGIGDATRARSMAQVQLDLHNERAKIDTAHMKERTTHKNVTEAASKDYLDESKYKRGGRAMRRAIKYGDQLGQKKIAEFDNNYLPKLQREGQKGKQESADTTGADVTTDTTPSNPSTPPTDRGKNPARAPRARGASIKEVTAAMSIGAIDKEQATMISPKFAAQEGRKAAAANFTPDSPQVTPSKGSKPRKPRTPKAGA